MDLSKLLAGDFSELINLPPSPPSAPSSVPAPSAPTPSPGRPEAAAAERNRYIAPDYNPNLGKPLYQPHDGAFLPDMAREVEAGFGSIAQGIGWGLDRLTGSKEPGMIARLGNAITENAEQGMSEEQRLARSQELIHDDANGGYSWEPVGLDQIGCKMRGSGSCFPVFLRE